ncbi:hypothetical protein HK101_007320 [Irineochytrium annulatum]|nr:hypothetical protein HK101_007320 [Irineochytrium annulatum]
MDDDMDVKDHQVTLTIQDPPATPPRSGAATKSLKRGDSFHNASVHSFAEIKEEPLTGVQDVKKVERRTSYQFRALSRKAISYQKRQLFNNICCIGICPLMMIVISVLIGAVVHIFINSGVGVQQVMYCSNYSSLNQFNYPRTWLSDPGMTVTNASAVPFATQNVIHANYLTVTDPSQAFGGSAGIVSANPCARVFTKRHMVGPLPYFPVPSIPYSYIDSDATFLPQPKLGWLDVVTIESMSTDFVESQIREWFVVSAAPTVPKQLLGVRPERFIKMVNTTSPLKNYPFPPMGFNPVNTSAVGILNTWEVKAYMEVDINIYEVAGMRVLPYFVQEGSSVQDMDDIMAGLLTNAIQKLAAIDKHVLFLPNPSGLEKIGFFVNASKALLNMPLGGIVFDRIDHASLSYDYTLSIGNDKRLAAGAAIPSAGLRQLIAQSQLANSFLRTSNPVNLGNTVISQTTRAFPKLASTDLSFPFGSYLGGILYPFGVSFLLPIFTVTLVQEKEARIAIMMRMNGLSVGANAIAHYVTFYGLYVISSLVFIVAGVISKLELFSKTDPTVLLILFFVWGHTQLSMSFFFASIFKQSRLALVTVFLIVLCGVIISIAIEQLYSITTLMPPAILVWPPFAFYRALNLLNVNAYRTDLRPYVLQNLGAQTDEVRSCVVALAIEAVALLLLTCYIDPILPREYGAPLAWHWPISEPVRRIFGAAWKNSVGAQASSSAEALRDASSSAAVTIEDLDVRRERERVLSGDYDPTAPLVVENMRKLYPSRPGTGRAGTPKVAVSGMTLAVEQGVVFGLLGPNGAGKTTLISILTGLYGASDGKARLAGFDLEKETGMVHRSIGVCPQHDILWDDLTVEEHLLFYARLKGITPAEEAAVVTRALADVKLEAFRHRLTKGLSGGEKRRLSIAIALVGSPGVVFLDEPTTGLDPEVRRLIWDIISTAKAGKTIILTTHSMEEAEVCCNRIGIMAKGSLKCLGPSLHLKQMYGSGFKLQYTISASDRRDQAAAFVEQMLESVSGEGGYQQLDRFATSASYEFNPVRAGGIAGVFERMEEGKDACGIRDW